MSFSTTDTIVAIATPPGRGGIGVVRLSGPSARALAKTLTARVEDYRPRHATLATVWAPNGAPIDQAILTLFEAPASYTGDDVVEISAHGSPAVLESIVGAAIKAGARLAGPGEFTLRAFLNGRIDLAQAEAVADLIDAATPLQARAAFDQLSGTLTGAIAAIDQSLFDLAARLEASVDFPDEGYHFIDPLDLARELGAITEQLQSLLRSARRGRLLREGLQVAIVGAPNAGKSSLFNALVGADRAIVAASPGTTRDLVTEVADVEGVRVTFVDTAGLRDACDPVEAEGVRRANQTADVSNLILNVVDSSQPYSSRVLGPNILGVATKTDLPRRWSRGDFVSISVLTGEGLPELRRRIAGGLDREALNDVPSITNIRHIALVERAVSALERAHTSVSELGEALSEEFILADMQDARAALEEVTGRRTSDDLLVHIFSKFCIGK